jgi:anhydro-N-acetylmuramic acid kinase
VTFIKRRIAGCMTGTSLDALDVALIEIQGTGLELRASVVRCLTHPLGELTESLRALAAQEPVPAGRIADLAHRLAALHVHALRELLGKETVHLIAVHGQTVFHSPPVSWQLINPAPIAHAFGAPVVFDLRAADLAAGGQGAPITPLPDYLLLRDPQETRAVVNLGGFASFTLLPAEGAAGSGAVSCATSLIGGGDICACNHLLDGVARAVLGRPYDEGGRSAAHGRVLEPLRKELGALLAQQAAQRRSLGSGDELADWIERNRNRAAAEVLARTVCDALAATIVEVVSALARPVSARGIERWLLAGGGVQNSTLVSALRKYARAPVEATDAHGLPARYREAAAMAVLGALCQDGVPITLPQVTGVPAPAPLAGTWLYPSKSPS